MVFFILISIVSSLYAQDNCEFNDPIIKGEGIASLLSLKDHVAIPDFVAQKDIALNANCRNLPLKSEDATNYLDELEKSNSSKVTATINGVTLTDSPLMLSYFSQLTTKKNQNNDVIESQVSPVPFGCQGVRCYLAKILGERSDEQLYFLDRFGFNTSHLASTEAQTYNQKEWTILKQAIANMPGPLIGNNRPMQMIRISDEKSKKDLIGQGGRGSMCLHQNWQNKDKGEMESIFFHEMAHNLAFNLNQIDFSDEWKKVAGWEEVDDPFIARKKNTVLNPKRKLQSFYQSQDSSEDFAESVTAYRYESAKLKKENPKVYNFLKKRVFRGLEFTNKEDCNSKNNISEIFKQEMKLGPKLKSSDFSIEMLEHCKDQTLHSIMFPDYSKLSLCLYGAFGLNKIKTKKLADVERLDGEILARMVPPPSAENKEILTEMAKNFSQEIESNLLKTALIYPINAEEFTDSKDYCRFFSKSITTAESEFLTRSFKDDRPFLSNWSDIESKYNDKCLTYQKKNGSLKTITTQDIPDLLSIKKF